MRITLVTDELLGYTRTGGIGTATTFLALALGRLGHRVGLLYTGGTPETSLAADWARLYDDANVEIRLLERSGELVEPSYFGRMRDVERALAADPPDLVITQDLAAPAYTAIRLRALGVAFERTRFVVYCHGTRQWITDAARKVRVLPGALAITQLEQASIELADAVVSPSRYLVDWMRAQRWRLPETTHVIPHLNREIATGETQPRAEQSGDRVRRLAFFGRLEERKGIRPFIEGLNALDPALLEDVEVEFVGRPTPAWTPGRVRASLSDRIRTVSFATDLEQPEALARLARPGTLAVMPSYAETFGLAVRECLDGGIPFIAGNAAAIRELVAPEDQSRVLFEPTADGVAAALARAVSGDDSLRPVRAAFAAQQAYDAWSDLVETPSALRHTSDAEPSVDVVVVRRHRDDRACVSALEQQTYPRVNVTVADAPRHASIESARRAGLAAGNAPYVVFMDGRDEPAAEFVATLVRAQASCDADVVTCGVRLTDPPRQHLFIGDPGALGLLANTYGTAALIRRTRLDELDDGPSADADVDWLLLARLHAAGARIVSVPLPLLTRHDAPGTVERNPPDALLVAAEHERTLPESLRSLARLATGLAAMQHAPEPDDGIFRRVRSVARDEGLSGLVRRTGRRVRAR